MKDLLIALAALVLPCLVGPIVVGILSALVIASAAYRAGERLYSEYYGEYSDYTRKGGVICDLVHTCRKIGNESTLSFNPLI